MSGKRIILRVVAGILLVMMAMLSAGALAHSGRTDASGGHKDNKNKSGLGSYHYHCGGHPAHLHSSGVCPYSGSGKSSAKKPSPTATPVPVKYVDGILVPDWPDAFPLQKGSRNAVVKSLQKALAGMGYLNDKADGIFGNNTDAAVEMFYSQVYNSFFEYDGQVDEDLYIAIMKSYEEIQALQDAA